ncbi:Coiled-coil domain-containing protein C6orf97 [Echinococcus granulosus]|uniref:Coiled-coil domain-containing protein C6orf97 n=1 Tax=Echinococcus granulosus TaxID=6210 RepID=W6U6N4_ECHGR|nr:Coiled-coil domain-containing protein C6orf97 [Echinococcus granulosus]EUB56875.1 Coiled-coil domain-containing protein C6orf97 [Echinococcus granulosus]
MFERAKVRIWNYEALKFETSSLVDEGVNFEAEHKAARELEEQREARTDPALKKRGLQEGVEKLTSVLERAHLEAKRRESRFRRLSDATHTNTAVDVDSESLITSLEHRALQEFLHFIRRHLKCGEEQSMRKLLVYTKDDIVKREEELKLVKSELRDLEIQVKAHREKLASLSLMKDEKATLAGAIPNSELTIKKLQSEQNNFRQWISKLVDQLKLKNVESESEYPLLMDAIAVRVKALVSNESEKIVTQRSRLAQLQQQNRELRERNDDLEVQLTLLRRRLADLEGGEAEARKHLASAAATDREHKRLTKQLERTRTEVYTLQAENARLKNEAISDSQSALAAVGTNALLHAAESRVKELQVQCKQLENEAQSLRRDKLQMETASNLTIRNMQQQIASLEGELDSVRRSEDQLLEFRSVVARLLNLKCDYLCVPDFEIVHRLEQVVLALDSPGIQELHKSTLLE